MSPEKGLFSFIPSPSQYNMKLLRKKYRKGDTSIYCGRPSLMGNPYVIGKDGTREEVIEKFRQDLWRKIKEKDVAIFGFFRRLQERLEYQDVVLSCWCRKSENCHVDVIIKCFEWGVKENLWHTDPSGSKKSPTEEMF